MSAVEYIHSMGVAHGDIRAENLLLNKDGSRLKVAGFGRAVRVDVDVKGDDYVYAQQHHLGRTRAAHDK